MNVSLEQFTKEHLAIARLFAEPIPRAKELCRLVYESLDGGPWPKSRREAYAIFYRINAAQPSAIRALERILGPGEAAEYNVDEISTDEFLQMVMPALQPMRLLTRAVLALNIVEYDGLGLGDYRQLPVATLLNKIFARLEGRASNVRTFADVAAVLDGFREEFCSLVTDVDKCSGWLCSVVMHRRDVDTEYRSFKEILDYCTKPADIRFQCRSGSGKVGRHGRLRSMWNNHKKTIQRELRSRLGAVRKRTTQHE